MADGIFTRLGRMFDKAVVDMDNKSQGDTLDRLLNPEHEVTLLDMLAGRTKHGQKAENLIHGGESVHVAPKAGVTPPTPKTGKNPYIREI